VTVLTEIYLCHACSCQEIPIRNGRGQDPEPNSQLTIAADLKGFAGSKGWHVHTYPVRRPLRSFRRSFWLRFTYVTSVLAKKC
jgi:hypothetical protein